MAEVMKFAEVQTLKALDAGPGEKER